MALTRGMLRKFKAERVLLHKQISEVQGRVWELCDRWQPIPNYNVDYEKNDYLKVKLEAYLTKEQELLE